MDLKQRLAVGFNRLGQDLDVVAVMGGIGSAWLAIIITRLINGPHQWEWFGAAVGASICAALLTKQRERSRRQSTTDAST
jgi:hypothetical protein